MAGMARWETDHIEQHCPNVKALQGWAASRESGQQLPGFRSARPVVQISHPTARRRHHSGGRLMYDSASPSETTATLPQSACLRANFSILSTDCDTLHFGGTLTHVAVQSATPGGWPDAWNRRLVAVRSATLPQSATEKLNDIKGMLQVALCGTSGEGVASTLRRAV